ncbi:ankyrin repeat domain-containing protein, partial [Candidatus Dependentiae bacterium]|nr:ankyrin repeat domain-containing protein [Candidatus Dependentiae bacterium]
MKKIIIALLLMPLMVIANKEELDKALLEACKKGNIKQVQQLIKQGASVQATMSRNSHTTMSIAIEGGHRDVVELLLEHGAQVDTADCRNNTALHKAAEHGKTDIVKLLLANGAKVGEAGIFGYTPLHKAAQNGHAAVVELLLEHNASLFLTDHKGVTPFCWAARKNRLAIIKIFLKFLKKNGRNDEETIIEYNNALHEAVKAEAAKKNTPLVKLLIENGAQPSAHDLKTPVVKNNHALLKLLINTHAHLDKSDPQSNLFLSPALHQATEKGNLIAVNTLLDAGAVLAPSKEEVGYYKPNSLLGKAVCGGYIDLVKLFLNKSANQNNCSTFSDIIQVQEEPLLHWAVGIGNAGIVELLLKAGVSPDAVYSQHLSLGAGYSPVTLPVAPIHIAALYGYTKIVHMLLNEGVNPSAAIKIDSEAVRNFPYIRFYEGKTPLDLAHRGQKDESVQFLKEYLEVVEQVENNATKELLDQMINKPYVALVLALLICKLPLRPEEIKPYFSLVKRKYEDTGDDSYKAITRIFKEAYKGALVYT